VALIKIDVPTGFPLLLSLSLSLSLSSPAANNQATKQATNMFFRRRFRRLQLIPKDRFLYTIDGSSVSRVGKRRLALYCGPEIPSGERVSQTVLENNQIDLL
jgi:hypothetical protein